MPDSPPRGYEEHSAVHYAGFGVAPQFGLEDGRVQQHRKAEAGVLDADLDGNRAAVAPRQLHQRCPRPARPEGAGVMQQHKQEYEDDVLDEALVFINTSKQAARIRCATIGWNAANKILGR